MINAGGNTIVKEGIFGHGRGQIIAKGSVYARILENAKVEAGTTESPGKIGRNQRS